ncbi:MAG: response regulator [Candidatus Aminicenantes bacterium]|nr:response regulator [Candidatus Aminicenantes bacterium]NIM82504.1 response regulator [Candidatus Aminicenantes bacterium]NIN21862.1 response regulator [Candidatus Aminicenantes bacterium]NIN45640.1 response regulator [Candidatus Aminicenantes bacterium]NIN88473.1 response regulator [Candidatus Aminicenantes bacterium]
MKCIYERFIRRFAFLFLMALLFFIFISTTFTFPQSYLVKTYSENEGLPSATVHDIAQDHWGRIWFATRAGIAVYDGVSWRTYTVSDGLPLLSFLKIKVDRKGRIWALSDSRQAEIYVVYHDGHEDMQWTQLKEINVSSTHFTELTAFQLVEQKQTDIPVIAVGTAKRGVFLWNQGNWENLTKTNGLRSNTINGIAALNGKFYVATDQGMSIIKIINGNVTINNQLNQSLELPSRDIKGICIEYKDKFPDAPLIHSRIWLFGHDWVGYFSENTLKMTVYPMEIFFAEKNETVTLSPDYRGGLYIGKLYRALYFDIKTRSWEFIGAVNGLISEGANSIFIDFEKNIWIVCDRGVSRISSRRFSNFQMIHGLLEDEVTAVVEYEPGKFVLGHNIGITISDGREFLRIPFHRSKGSSSPLFRVLDIQLDSKKNVWLAAARAGLGKIDLHYPYRMTWYGRENGLLGNIVSLWIDKKTDNIWVGTDLGIYFRTKTGKFVLLNLGKFPSFGVRKIFGDSGKLHYLLSGKFGVFVYVDKEKLWKNYQVPGNKKANDVYALKRDSQGRLLIGSLAGAFILENHRLKKFKDNNFQVDRPVYFITEDHKHRLWFGTDNGVVRWDGKRKRVYSVGEGLIGQETNRAAGIVDTRGRVWIGTNRGVSIYDESFDCSEHSCAEPKVQLLYMDVSGNKIPLKGTKPAELHYNDNTITLHYRGISFQDETAVCFKSKLEGFDKEWLTESYPYKQMRKYTNLPAGVYRFHLKASNALGMWSNVVTSREIIILKPFYKQWWFFLVAFLLATVILFSIVQFISEKRYAALLEKQVEERSNQLQALEKRYRTLFIESKDAVFISTPEGRLIDINPAGVELFGFHSRDEALTMSSGLEIYNTLEDRAAFREEIEKKGYVKDYELVYKRKDGYLITALVTATLVRDKEGNITAYRGIIRDITEQKRLEQQLAQAQKMEAIGTLAGGIAHDFNNLLGVILGNAELLTDDIPEGKLGRQNLQNILNASERAAELVKQILAFSRQSERKRSPINLSATLKGILRLLRSSLPSTIEIHQDIRIGTGIVLANPTQIHQIMMNLAANAAHAMREKGGVLEVNLDEVYMDTETTKSYDNIKTGYYLRLAVIDTGRGMSPEVMKRIFDPYFTTKEVGEGSGMGLAVVHGIVKSCGGYISVYSEPGKGTTFHVFLPKVEGETEQKTPVTEDGPGGTERIMLVDDESELIDVGMQVLERMGYKVIGTTDPMEALAVFRKEPDQFDLVISDLTMPRLTGIQLIEEIRRLRPDIPIILCSGFSSAATVEQIRALGIDDFILKPIIKSDLARKVRSALDKR